MDALCTECGGCGTVLAREYTYPHEDPEHFTREDRFNCPVCGGCGSVDPNPEDHCDDLDELLFDRETGCANLFALIVFEAIYGPAPF